MLARSAPRALALFSLALAACAARTGRDHGPTAPRRPTADVRLPAEDGLVLSALGTEVRTPWSNLDAATRARFDEARWEAARAELPGRADQLTYASGGHRVGAFLVRPSATAGRRLPVVLLCRDGVGTEGLAPEALLVELEAWSREGYVAIATAYRGNALSQGTDEAGSPADVLALLPLVRELGYADPERVFLLGRGTGGARVLAALAATERVQAAAVVGTPTRGADDAFGIAEPLLIVHGAEDEEAPLAATEALAAALAAAGTEHALEVLPGTGHDLAGRHAEVDERVAAWFAAHGGRSLFD